jgi:hypothetical protein
MSRDEMECHGGYIMILTLGRHKKVQRIETEAEDEETVLVQVFRKQSRAEIVMPVQWRILRKRW